MGTEGRRHRITRPLLNWPVVRGLLILWLVAGSWACAPAISADSPLGERVLLTGAGASFPSLIYQSWFIALNHQRPELRVNYQSLGSGAGIEQFMGGTIDFGASDVAMSDAEMAMVDRGGVVLLPMTAGSIVLAYNLPLVAGELRLPRSVYVDIFLGRLTHWDDPPIGAANPDLALPHLPITVVHRADGSGTTEVFTRHLSAISPGWRQAVGSGKSVDWPNTGIFVGSKGNEGVTAQVQQIEGALGYVEYSYAIHNQLTMAALENRAGQFVFPSEASGAATLEAVQLPESLRVFITDPPGQASYPIVTYTWLLLHQQYDNRLQARALEMMVEFCLNQGQQAASILGYIPLPLTVRQQVAAAADQISRDYSITLRHPMGEGKRQETGDRS